MTLQYCNGFCHTLTWSSHGYTGVPHPEPPFHLPPHKIYFKWACLKSLYFVFYICRSSPCSPGSELGPFDQRILSSGYCTHGLERGDVTGSGQPRSLFSKDSLAHGKVCSQQRVRVLTKAWKWSENVSHSVVSDFVRREWPRMSFSVLNPL